MSIFGNKEKKQEVEHKRDKEPKYYDVVTFRNIQLFLYDDDYGLAFSYLRKNKNGEFKRTIKQRMFSNLILALAELAKTWSEDAERLSEGDRRVWKSWADYLAIIPEAVDEMLEKAGRPATANGEAPSEK